MATLEGKTIILFGGSSGIGFAVAEACLLSHASLVIIVSSNVDRVAAAVRRLEAAKLGLGKVQGEAVDASDHTELREFVNRIGEVDHIVWTCRPRGIRFDFQNIEVESPKSMFDLSFWGPVVVAQNAKIRAGGSITLTTGYAVTKPQKTWSIVAGVAGAIDSLTRGLAVDLAPIRVNVISSGFVKTELWKDFPEAGMQKLYAEAEERLLVKHVAIPSETAEAYLFVMKCTYITGQRIEVDGGYVLGA